MNPSDLVLFRGIERLIIVVAATLAIYLGYRLFVSIPTFHGSDGKLTLPKASLTLSKVGPGVFFALFGTAVLWRAAEQQVRVSDQNWIYGTGTVVAERSDTDLRQREQLVHQVRDDVAVINCLVQTATPHLQRLVDPERINGAAHEARVALIISAWQPVWDGQGTMTSLRSGVVPRSGPVAEIYNAVHPRCVPPVEAQP